MQSQRSTLEIYIDRLAGDGAYPVTARVLESHQSARSSMVLTLSSVELADAQRWLAEGDADTPAVQDFGARLCDALFAGPVRLLYDQLVGDPDRSPAFWILIGVGIPILVGMQAPVTASDAMLFTAELYGSLADGRSVDGALLDVRRVARQRSAEGRTAPAIPVCYTRNMPACLVNAPAAPSTTGKGGLRRLWGLTAATVALVVGILSGYVSMRDFFCVPPVRGGLPAILGSVCGAIAPLEAPVVVVAPTATIQPRLTGDFKIAVAEFAPAGGASDAGAKGSELAQQLYDQLRDNLDAMASAASVPFRIDVGLAPQEVGRIEGDSYQAQIDNAVRRAREINADLLIFGNLDASPDKTVLDAYFYQAPTQLHTAEEMAGAYPLAHVESTGNVLDNMVTSSELRSKLLTSADGMGRFLFGLGFFNRQHFNEAAR